MIGSQNQSVSEDGQAYQAGRDLAVHHHHGVSPRYVSELVDICMHYKLPVFHEETRKIAEASAAEFCKEFISQARKSETLSEEEFKQPDSQDIFSKALSGYAIKGDSIDVKLLVSALIQRLEATEQPLLKQALEVAIELMPKLSRSQIAFLAFVQYTKSVRHTSVTSLIQLEQRIAPVMKAVEPGLALSNANKQYLASIGAVTINSVADANNLLPSLQRSHSFLEQELAQVPPLDCPSFRSMLRHYGDMEIPTVFPTIGGCAIGLLFLQTVWGQIDLTVWIK